MNDLTRSEAKTSKVSRRNFVKGAATIATVAAVVPLNPLLGGKESVADAANGNNSSSNRMNACFNYRKNRALAQRINVGPQVDNGDASQFTDFSGNFSKALLH